MPRAFALALSAASNGLGTRIFICSSFFSNSNRAGLNCEKSSSDRSCARNASAALSVLSFGTFFFIGGDLIRMHVAGRHGTNEAAAVLRPQGEGHKHGPPGGCPPHDNHAVFVPRISRIGCNARSVPEQRLYFINRNAVSLGLRAVAAVPVKSRYAQSYHSSKLCKCIYKCRSPHVSSKTGPSSSSGMEAN